MLEKVKGILSHKKERKESEKKSTGGKKTKTLLTVVLLFLLLGIAIGFLLQKPVLVFLLPLSGFVLTYLLLPEKEKERHPEREKFLKDFYLFASLEKESDKAMTMALEEMDISKDKDEIVNCLEAGSLTRECLLYDNTFQAEEAVDRVLLLYSAKDLDLDEIVPLGKLLPKEEEDSLSLEVFPFLIVLFLILVSLAYLGGITP